MKSWQEEYKTVVAKGMVALVAAVLICWLFVLPVFQQSEALQRQIGELETQLQRQKVFLPVFERLEAMLAQKQAEGLAVPEPKTVNVRDLDALPAWFVRAALDAGLEVLDVVVSPGSLRSGSGRVMLQCVLFGDQARFERFYRDVGAMPFVDHVDKIELQVVPGGVEFFLELWVFLDEGQG